MKTFKLTINNNKYSVDIKEDNGDNMTVNVNGMDYVVNLEHEQTQVSSPVQSQAPTRPVATPAPSNNAPAQPNTPPSKPNNVEGGTKIETPLPGTILDVLVKEGDTVKAGQCVLVLEAMKMENNIESETDGTVASINVRKGDSVLEGQLLMVIK